MYISVYNPFTITMIKFEPQNGMSIINDEASCLEFGNVHKNETVSRLELFTSFTQRDSSLSLSKLWDPFNKTSVPL